ncbi:MAG: hypothetical protein OK422_04385 [Thaumarchaeota archaeon]|nr:hypothetical protein [Nitrososphaerota archaeon]
MAEKSEANKKTKPPTPKLVEAVFTWNGLVNPGKRKRENPEFPFKTGDKLLVKLVGDTLIVSKADSK